MENLQFDQVIVERGSETSPIYDRMRRTLAHLPFKIVDNIAPDDTALPRGQKNTLFEPAQRRVFKEMPGKRRAGLL